MPKDIPATCDGCGKKFSIEHATSCPKGGLVLERHDDATKEWGALGAWSLIPSAITYESKINSRTVQGERTGGQRAAERRRSRRRHGYCRVEGKQGSQINRATRTGSSTCRVEGSRKRPRLLEAGDHYNL